MLTASCILQLSAIRIVFTCVTGKLTDSLDLLQVMFSPYVAPCALGGPLRVVGVHVCVLLVLRMDSNVCRTMLDTPKLLSWRAMESHVCPLGKLCGGYVI